MPVTVRRPWSANKILAVAGGVFLLAVIVIGDISSKDVTDGRVASDDPGVNKYEQTWPKDYSSTTCAEWDSDMTEAQRFAAAADMLAGARNKGDGDTGLPPDTLITTFQGDVSEGCVMPEMNLAEVGAFTT